MRKRDDMHPNVFVLIVDSIHTAEPLGIHQAAKQRHALVASTGAGIVGVQFGQLPYLATGLFQRFAAGNVFQRLVFVHETRDEF